MTPLKSRPQASLSGQGCAFFSLAALSARRLHGIAMAGLFFLGITTALDAAGVAPGPQITLEQPAGKRLSFGNAFFGWGLDLNGEALLPPGLHGIKAVSAGGQHNVALMNDGTVTAWGSNSVGESSVPKGLADVQAVAAGDYYGLALKNDGTVAIWGAPGWNLTEVPAGLTEVTAISAGGTHAAALKKDGTVVVWGDNTYGQKNVPAGLSGVKAIAAGGAHVLALRGNGTVVAWGDNAYGEVRVPAGLTGVKAIAAGDYFSVALRTNGTIVAWGLASSGRSSIPAGLSGITAIAAGAMHIVALKSNGTVLAWGENMFGQCTVPSNLGGVTAISAGYGHTLALTAPQVPEVRFADTPSGRQSVPVPFAVRNTGTTPLVLGALTFAAPTAEFSVSSPASTTLAPGAATTFAVTFSPAGLGARTASLRIASNDANGSPSEIKLTGVGLCPEISISGPASTDGRLGTPFDQAFTQDSAVPGAAFSLVSGKLPPGLVLSPSGGVRGIPTQAGSFIFTVRVTASSGCVSGPAECTIAIEGLPRLTVSTLSGMVFGGNSTLLAWGNNSLGQTRVPAGTANARAFAAGYEHTLALRLDGTVAAWGDNSYGQRAVPAGLGGITAVAAGGYHSVALRGNGTVAAWGDNTFGQRSVPAGLKTVKAVSAGFSHTVALRADGSVAAWGSNECGQRSVPAGLSGVAAIAAGGRHTVALKNDGSIIAWGDNSYGQATVPAGLGSVFAIAAGYAHTVALKADGTVVAWGLDAYGQTDVPAGLTEVAAIAAGYDHTVALKKDGTVVVWGRYFEGQSQVPALAGRVIAISAGGYHTVAQVRDASGINFGSTAMGAVSQPIQIVLQNTGTVALEISPSIFGPQAGDFAFSSFPTHPLLPGGGTVISLTFNPAGPGSRQATLRLLSNDEANSPLDLSLGGTSTCAAFKVLNPPSAVISSGIAFSQKFTQIGSPGAVFRLASGTLPPGMALAATGVLSGTATTAGTYTFTVQATDAFGCTVYAAPASVQVRSNAVLQGLAISAGTLSPAFPTTFAQYFATVAYDQDSIRVTPAATDLTDLITINGVPFAPGGPGIPLSVGSNVIDIVVAAKDGTRTSRYQLIITRPPPPHLVVEDPSGALLVLPHGTVVEWGYNQYNLYDVLRPAGLTDVAALAAGASAGDGHVLALKADGTLVAWGNNDFFQGSVPNGLSGIRVVAVGSYHNLVLKADGTVFAWGRNNEGECTVPAGLSGVIAIAGGLGHSVALTAGGTVFAWGGNTYGAAQVPAGLVGVRAIAAGFYHTLALKNDGTVAGWGYQNAGLASLAPGLLTGIKAIAAGRVHSVALKNDGTVVTWGDNTYHQTAMPPGITGIKAIAAGDDHTLALRIDGTVVGWGDNGLGATTIPAGLADVQMIAAGGGRSLAVVRKPPPFTFSPQPLGSASAPATFTIRNPASGDLILGGFTLDGLNPGDFVVSLPASTTLAPGASTTFTVTFTPGATGARSAVLHLASNDGAALPYDIALKGSTTVAQPAAGAASSFAGFVSPFDTIMPDAAASGFLTATVVPATGVFTASLKLGGRTIPITGRFDPSGTARFGSRSAASSLALPSSGSPSGARALKLHWTTDGGLTGSVVPSEGKGSGS
ncbi:MAG: hypothetical protein JWO94_1058 [Verrucomicrobiaceae bacterium]|nr:hypothetical protein [Verrucomicrobiaceae bacterium]